MAQDDLDFDGADEAEIRDFLLGKSADADRDELEKRILTDPAFSELVSAIEDELIDAYTDGLVPKEDRHWFETRFLVTEDRRRKVRFSTALGRLRLDELAAPAATPAAAGENVNLVLPRPSSHGWMQMAAAAVVLLSLGSAVWTSQTMKTTVSELDTAKEQIASLQKSRDELAEELRRQQADTTADVEAMSLVAVSTPEPPEPSTSASDSTTVSLIPGALRDDTSRVPSVRVPSSSLLVELRLELLENTHPAYSASLRDASGDEVLRVRQLRARAEENRIVVSFEVPSAYLPAGDYSIRLQDPSAAEPEELERYYLRVAVD